MFPIFNFLTYTSIILYHTYMKSKLTLYVDKDLKELAKKTGISIKGIEWSLAKLKENGILKRIGPDRGGHWEITGGGDR